MSESNVEELQDQLEHRRQSLDETLASLERRLSILSIQEFVSSPLRYMQDSVLAEYGGNLRDAVSRNPVPVALLAVSLVWLMMGGQATSARLGETLQQKAAAAGDQLKAGAEIVRDKVKAGAQSLQERVEETAANLQGKAQETADRVRSKEEAMAEGSRDRLQQLRYGSKNYGMRLQRHPLALSVVGLAVGAVLAALLPETQAEIRALGETRDRLAEKATAKGERLVEGAKSALRAGAKAATDEAQGQVE